MAAALLLFGRKYWLQIIAILFVVGVIFAGYIYVKSKDNKIQELMKENITLTIERNTYKSNWETVKGALEEQNRAIQVLSTQFKDTKENFKKLGVLVNTKTGQLSSKLDGIKKSPIPQTCPESIDYLYEAAKEYKK